MQKVREAIGVAFVIAIMAYTVLMMFGGGLDYPVLLALGGAVIVTAILFS